MRFTERLKLENEPKSTQSAGKLFQRFKTRSAKKLHLTELLQKRLKILYGWPTVADPRFAKGRTIASAERESITGVRGRSP